MWESCGAVLVLDGTNQKLGSLDNLNFTAPRQLLSCSHGNLPKRTLSCLKLFVCAILPFAVRHRPLDTQRTVLLGSFSDAIQVAMLVCFGLLTAFPESGDDRDFRSCNKFKSSSSQGRLC